MSQLRDDRGRSYLGFVPPDFLNSREDAAIVWVVAIFCFAVFKDPRGVGVSLWSCLRALAHWKLLVLFGSTLLYSALIVYGASRIGLWHTAALKATIYWFIITGVVLVGEAVGRFANPRDPKFRRKVLGRVISLTIVIEFLVNLYAFPLAYELVLTLFAITAVGLQVVLQRDRAADADVRKVVDSAIVILGVIVLAHFLVRALTDLHGLLVRENAEDFLVGPALTITLIPLLFLWAWISRWEQERLRQRFRLQRGHA